MKLSDWISENKTLFYGPVLTFFAAVLFVVAYNHIGNANNSDQTAIPSYPTPTIATADDKPSSAREAVPPAAESPAAATLAADTAKVVFQVDGMSCSGCIATIKSSLAGYDGLRDIIVNISGGTTDVYYESGKIKDLDALATAITAAGYPARISEMMTAEQVKEAEAISNARAKVYIASVGEWDISRTDFDTELAYAVNRYKKAYGQNVFSDSRGKSALDSIKAQIVSRLVNEGIQMQEVQRVGYRIDPKIVDQEFSNFLGEKNIDLEGLKTSMQKNGYPFDYFMRKFENRVLLSNYIENEVLNNAASDYDKQQQYLAWFNNARILSKVTIYDKQLERLTQSQSGGGCGSSCQS
jgi:copper chaperone CopZ